jgi:hypothetical protein
MARQFIVLCGQIVGDGTRPFETVYAFDGERFSDRKKAIRHGFKVRGSDDFNIGVIESGKLTSMDWMEQPVDTDPALLADIQEQIFL